MGWLISVLLRQNYEDRLAIAIEAGIQNTGIAIFVLRYALPQPEADLTTVVSFIGFVKHNVQNCLLGRILTRIFIFPLFRCQFL